MHFYIDTRVQLALEVSDMSYNKEVYCISSTTYLKFLEYHLLKLYYYFVHCIWKSPFKIDVLFIYLFIDNLYSTVTKAKAYNNSA